jgi:monoamine oxidase
MHRREFLQKSSALAALPLLPGLAAAEPPRRRVVIIGAGLAGLAAGYELKRRGHKVTILEARSRPGGRVHTLREPFDGGQHAEAGAMFVPSSHDLTVKYARLFRLALKPIPARRLSPTLYLHGRKIAPDRRRGFNWPIHLSPSESRMTLDEISETYLGPVLDQLGNPRSPSWPPARLRALDQTSYGEFLRRRGASPGAIELMRLNDAELIGDGIESVSALYVLRETKFYETAYQTYSIAGGSDRLPFAFAERLKDEISYNRRVYRIDRSGSKVTITTHGPDSENTVEADVVICAVPLSVLNRIVFTPELPETLRRAQSEVGYTSVTRVYTQTKDRPWDQPGFGMSAYTDLPSMTLVNSTLDQPGPGGIMHSYMTGRNARAAAQLDENGRRDAALADMEKLFPGMRKNVIRSASKAWDDDEWSRGAFVWFRPGQMFDLRPRLQQPVDGIVFAGEHLSDYPGWMQGALESGLRAATEVTRRTSTALDRPVTA